MVFEDGDQDMRVVRMRVKVGVAPDLALWRRSESMKGMEASSRLTWSDRLGRSSIADPVNASIIEPRHVDNSVVCQHRASSVLLHYELVSGRAMYGFKSSCTTSTNAKLGGHDILAAASVHEDSPTPFMGTPFEVVNRSLDAVDNHVFQEGALYGS
jgi:hypothetical protein